MLVPDVHALAMIQKYLTSEGRQKVQGALAGRGLQDVQQTVAAFMGHYQKLPPGPDRDQALNILGYFLRDVTTPSSTAPKLSWDAYFIAYMALSEKVKQTGEGPVYATQG